VNNIELGIDLFKASTIITGAEWPDLTVARSPCPTLNVIGAISKGMIEKEELKRMVERPGFDEEGKVIKVAISKRKKAKIVAQKVVGGVFRRTVGRVAKFLGRRVLGRVPETALQGTFQEEKPEDENPILAKRVVTAEVVTTPSTSTPISETSLQNKDSEGLASEISEKVFGEYKAVKSESNDSDLTSNQHMKSDDQLIEELMTGKNSGKVEKEGTVA